MSQEQFKWNQSINLILESIYKPDAELRNTARQEDCYDELMTIRLLTLNYLQVLRK